MRTHALLLPVSGLLLAACAAAPVVPPATSTLGPASAPPPAAAAVAVAVDVYKSPSCTCCHEWEAYLRDLGYQVRSLPVEDMAAVKGRLGVPEEAWSCHTAVIDGYAVEGHVPAAAIVDLLAARPAIDGIALPGMPAGSPGMPGAQEAPFEVLAIDDGTASAFGSY
jgi:hypothetical protein